MTMTMTDSVCPLCVGVGGTLVYQGDKFRVIRAEESDFPAFYRLVWTAHVAEFSDLDRADRHLCMELVNEVERVLRTQLEPTKINLATLGNVVAHVHWHVIARFDWDSHFPGPVWALPKRPADQVRLESLNARLPAAEQAMVTALTLFGQTSMD
jgi:diadenosine tetraphosphate (Ap4A) HIT family hydrolase